MISLTYAPVRAEPKKIIAPGPAAIDITEFKTSSPPRAVAIVTHGLNTAPEAMDTLSSLLAAEGIHTFRLRFSRGAEVPAETALARRWNDELKAAYGSARTRFPGLPVINLSYSLGAAVTVAALDSAEQDSLKFDSMVLIAPAIALRPGSAAIRLLSILNSDSIRIPSLAPREYREKSYTSIREYAALFSINKEVRVLSHPERLRPIRTLIIQDQADELVRTAGLRSWLAEYQLPGWKLVVLKRGRTGYPAHILLDARSAGEAAWLDITREIRAFLSPPPPA